MRLTALLLTWPRNRPNGHIYLGKHKMVRKVTPGNMRVLDKDIQRVSIIEQLLVWPISDFRFSQPYVTSCRISHTYQNIIRPFLTSSAGEAERLPVSEPLLEPRGGAGGAR